jgi:deoxycytidine triphosphate deaminase
MKHIMSDSSSSSLTNVQDDDVQPNAVDLRLGKVFSITNNRFTISEAGKEHRGSKLIEPDEEFWYDLEPGMYEVIMENVITVGTDEAGFVITRSSLNRNGVFLTSGLYDTGYSGVMAGVMHVGAGPMSIRQGTRIGQYLNFNAESLFNYDGDYGNKKDHDKKYGENE